MAMGLVDNLVGRWSRSNDRSLRLLVKGSKWSGGLSAASKFFRMALQIAMTAAGAALVLQNELTPGGMIAGSILLGRALSPVDQAINSWKNAVAARDAFARLKKLLSALPIEDEASGLPEPEGTLSIKGLGYAFPKAKTALFNHLSFELKPGDSLGVVGPTACGKTTLSRLLVGNIAPHAGHVRLDGVDVSRWEPMELGRHVGYLPQDIELFDGTVSDNIARMGKASPKAVIEAAKAADVHHMILRLPHGYETRIGDGGVRLSGGQRQRIALARALFGAPCMVILDEPNASLDFAGDKALIGVLESLGKKRVTTVLITHRPSILRHVDRVLVLRDDGTHEVGSGDQMMESLTNPVSDVVRLRKKEARHEHPKSA